MIFGTLTENRLSTNSCIIKFEKLEFSTSLKCGVVANYSTTVDIFILN